MIILIAIDNIWSIWCSNVALPANNLAALGHPRSCSIALSRAILLRSARMLLWYRSQAVWATNTSSLLWWACYTSEFLVWLPNCKCSSNLKARLHIGEINKPMHELPAMNLTNSFYSLQTSWCWKVNLNRWELLSRWIPSRRMSGWPILLLSLVWVYAIGHWWELFFNLF